MNTCGNMLFELGVFWDAIRFTILESWDRHQVKRKMKEKRKEDLTFMIDSL